VDRRFRLSWPLLRGALTALLFSTALQAADPPLAPRVEQRIEFFKPGSARIASVAPLSVGAGTGRQGVPHGETLALQQFQLGDFDPSKAVAGDRVVLAVNGGESFEIVLSEVTEAPSGISIFWHGRSPHDPNSDVFLQFVRENANQKAALRGGSLQLPELSRQFTIDATSEKSGFALVREVKAGTGYADLSHDEVDAGAQAASDPESKRR